MTSCLRHGRRSTGAVGGGGPTPGESSRTRTRLARDSEEGAETPAASAAGDGDDAREGGAGAEGPVTGAPGRFAESKTTARVGPCRVPAPRDVLARRRTGAPSSFGAGDDDGDNSDGDSTISSKTNFRRRERVELDFSGPGRGTCVTPSPSRRLPRHQRWFRPGGHFTAATRAAAWGEVLSLSREDVEGLTEDEATVYSSMSQDSSWRYLLSKDEEIWSLMEYLDRKALEFKGEDPVCQENSGDHSETKIAQSAETSTKEMLAKTGAQSNDTSEHADLNAGCRLGALPMSGGSDSSNHYVGTINCVGLNASQSSQRQDGADEFHGHNPLDTSKGLGNDKRSDDSTVSTTMIEIDMPPSSSSDWEGLCHHCSQTNETYPHAADHDERSNCLLEKDEMIRILRESADQANRQRAEMERRLVEMEARKTKEHAEMKDKILELESEWQNMTSIEKKTESRLTKYLAEISADLESYKAECASYREQILCKEREHAKVEQSLYEEKKKVLSLEAENQILLNIADNNQDGDTKSGRVAEKELAACKEKCEGYQQQVLELESRAMSAEEALESSSQKATALEQDKLMLEAKIDNITADRTRLESSLAEMNSEIKRLEQNLASKSSRQSDLETQLAQTKRSAEISENLACRFAKKNTDLKRRNEELSSRHDEMSMEVEDATALALRIDPLKNMIKDNEAHIARLHDDLSVARSNNLESLKKARTRYSAQIKHLTDRLRKEKDEKREVEVKNIELADKLASLEQECTKKDNIDSALASKEDQVNELTKQADELRRKHASKVKEMADRIETLVREKSEVYETLTSVLELRESRQVKGSKSRTAEIDDEPEETVEGKESKESELVRLQHELVKKVQDLRSDLKQAHSERDQRTIAGQQFADAMNELRAEKTILQADLESWNIGLCDR